MILLYLLITVFYIYIGIINIFHIAIRLVS